MDPVLLAGVLIYVAAFWAVSWRYPAVALAFVFGLAPFQNDLSGGVAGVKFSLSEIHLVLTLPLLLLALVTRDKRLKSWPYLVPCLVYFAVCVASGLVQWRGGAALTSLFQMALFFFVLIPVFAILARRPQELIPALWALLTVSTFLASVVLITRSQYVLGLHKNGTGGSLGCAVLVAFELWFYYGAQKGVKAARLKTLLMAMMVVISCGLLFTASRGGWISAVVGIVFIAAMRRQFALVGRLALVMIPMIAIGWFSLPPETRSYAFDFDSKRGNIEARLNNQNAAIGYFESNPLLGAGIGLRKQTDATQIVLFVLAETGVLGLVTFAAIFVSFFGLIWRTQARLARGEFAYSLLAIGGALMAARLGHSMVDHYWARGPTMMAWAAAGMATGVFLYGPKGSYTGRLRRARALVALHLIETLRRTRHGQSLPRLSALELQHANEALDLVLARPTPNGASANGSGPKGASGRVGNGNAGQNGQSARDPLGELAERVL